MNKDSRLLRLGILGCGPISQIAHFDAVRKTGGLDILMTSMGLLYDKGYRFTAPDRADLNRISG